MNQIRMLTTPALQILAVFVLANEAFTQVALYETEAGKQIQLQLVEMSDGSEAYLSWLLDGHAGMAQLQMAELGRGIKSYQTSEGLNLLQISKTEEGWQGRLEVDGKNVEVHLIKRPVPLPDWHFVTAEASFKHKSSNESGAMIELQHFFPTDANLSFHQELAAFYGLPTEPPTPEDMLQAEVSAFVERYINMTTTSDGKSLEISWMKSSTAAPAFVSHPLVCIAVLTQVSTGNQPSRKHFSFAIFDIQQHRMLKLSDVFLMDSMEALSVFLSNALRAQFGLGADDDLRLKGFYANKVMPNDNLVLGAGSLGFAYNVYELGPPALGSAVLMLPLNKIAHLLQPSFRQILSAW